MWKCVGTKGTLFTEVDLTDGEWTDYDEKVWGILLQSYHLITYGRLVSLLESLMLNLGGAEHEWVLKKYGADFVKQLPILSVN